MGDKSSKRPLLELVARGKEALANTKLREIALTASSPTAAKDVALMRGYTDTQAKSARFLALAVRDYPNEYESAIQELDAQASSRHATTARHGT